MTIYKRNKIFWSRERTNAMGVWMKARSLKTKNRKLAQERANALDLLTEDKEIDWQATPETAAPKTTTPEPKTGLSLPDALAERTHPSLGLTKGTLQRYHDVIEADYIPFLATLGVTHLNEVKASHARKTLDRWERIVPKEEIAKGRKGRRKEKLSDQTIINGWKTCRAFHRFFAQRYDEYYTNPWGAIRPKAAPKIGLQGILKVNRDKQAKFVAESKTKTLPIDLDGTETNWLRIKAGIVPFLRSFPKRYKTIPLTREPERFLALVELLKETGLRRSDVLLFFKEILEPSEDGFKCYALQVKTEHIVPIHVSRDLGNRLRSLAPLPWVGPPNFEGAGEFIFYDGSEPPKEYMDNKINRPLRELGQRLGIQGSVRPHRFRASFAIAREGEMSLKFIARLMGQSEVKTLETHYLAHKTGNEKTLERLNAKFIASDPAPQDDVIVN